MKKIIFLFLATGLLAYTGVGQDPEQLRKMKEFQERGEKITKAYDAISSASPSFKDLHEKGERGQMIVEAARTSDPALIPHLRVLADDKGSAAILTANQRRPRSLIGTEAYLAHVALAKLGDPNVLPEVFAELESPDFLAQDAAIAKLGEIGGKEAYRKLFQLLDDATPRPSTASDEIIRPKSEHAMGVLSRLFSDSPRSSDRAAWKAWAAKNKHLID